MILPALAWTAAVPVVATVVLVAALRGARGALQWLHAGAGSLVAAGVTLVVVTDGGAAGAVSVTEPWLVAAVGVVLVGPVGFLARARRVPRHRPVAAAAGVLAVGIGLLLEAGSLVLAPAWVVLHLACVRQLLRRGSRLDGSVVSARLRSTTLGVAGLAVAPLAIVTDGAVSELLVVALVVAVALVGAGSTALPRAGDGGPEALVAIEAALLELDPARLDLEPTLALVRSRLGAAAVTLVDRGGVLASTTSEDDRWRLLSVAALGLGEGTLAPLGDDAWLHVATTGRGELLVELVDAVELVGEPELTLTAWMAERIGLALERLDTRQRDREALASLRAADRMRDDFMATLSHELRTPLTSIRGFSEVLAGNASTLGPAQLQDLLGRVVRNAEELEAMIVGLLELTQARGRSEPHRVADYDLADLAERAVARSTSRLALHDVLVDVSSVPVHTDGGAVLDVLEALLDNVSKFTPPGTRVEVLGWVADGTAVLTVSDDGPGLPDELGARVLEPFVRGGDVLTRATRGVGIGLSIAVELARQLDGELQVEVPEVGTSLRLSLPARHRLADRPPRRDPGGWLDTTDLR